MTPITGSSSIAASAGSATDQISPSYLLSRKPLFFCFMSRHHEDSCTRPEALRPLPLPPLLLLLVSSAAPLELLLPWSTANGTSLLLAPHATRQRCDMLLLQLMLWLHARLLAPYVVLVEARLAAVA